MSCKNHGDSDPKTLLICVFTCLFPIMMPGLEQCGCAQTSPWCEALGAPQTLLYQLAVLMHLLPPFSMSSVFVVGKKEVRIILCCGKRARQYNEREFHPDNINTSINFH